MKIKALARSVVRYFRPAATSVSPKSDHPGTATIRTLPGPRRITGGVVNVDPRGKTRDQIQAEIIDQINAIRADAGMTARPVEAEEITAIMKHVDMAMENRIPDSELEAIRREGPGPIHPITGEHMPPPEQITWAHWVAMRDRTIRDGWVFCRLGVQLHNGNCFQAFGIVRGDFGVYWQPFWSCGAGDRELFACLIHLKTGGGIGVFQDLRLACDAAESMMAMRDVAWADVDPTDEASYAPVQKKIEDAWAFTGVAAAPFCIHEIGPDDERGPQLTLFMRAPQEHQPKEKLS